MKNLFIVANWKSNKTSNEAIEWMDGCKIEGTEFTNKEVILCGPFTLLSSLKSYILHHKSAITLGSQDISSFGEGAYTGEINAKQLKEFVLYTLVGHSERRRLLGETDTILKQKVLQAKTNEIIPIYCIQTENDSIPDDVTIVAYEPVGAIGSGHPDTPENAQKVSQAIKQKYPFIKYVLYGGSVAPENIAQFTRMQDIDGVLVGGASLNPEKFSQIIKNA